MSDTIQRINALTQEQRDAAYEAARLRIAGKQPQRADFDAQTQSDYPQWVVAIVTVLCVIFLLFAFIPSAQRLHAVALRTNAQIEGVAQNEGSVYSAALATVFMAEIGQVLFSLAASTVIAKANARRRIRLPNMLTLASWICLAIALSGNAVALGDHATESSIAFLETYAPPILVLITASVLKAQLLIAISQRFNAERSYTEALAVWKTQYGNAQQHASFDRTLANTLRDAIRNANKVSKAALRELTDQDWRALVLRERNASEWWDATGMELPAEVPAPLPLPEVRNVPLRLVGDVANGVSSTPATGEAANAAARMEGNMYVKECPQCGEAFRGETPRSATNRLVAHLKKHANERKNAQQPVEAVHALPVSVVSSNGKHSEVTL